MNIRQFAAAALLLAGNGAASFAAGQLTVVAVGEDGPIKTISISRESEIRFTPGGVAFTNADSDPIPYEGLLWLDFPADSSGICNPIAAHTESIRLADGWFIFNFKPEHPQMLTVADASGKTHICLPSWNGEPVRADQLPHGPVAVAAGTHKAKFIIK